MNNLKFMSKFKPKTRCIKEFEHWIVCIRRKQATLGDAVILLKRKTGLNFQKLSNSMKMFVLKNLEQ